MILLRGYLFSQMLFIALALPTAPKPSVALKFDLMDEQAYSTEYKEKLSGLFDVPLLRDNDKLENCRQIECVPHFLCINGDVVTNGTELFDLKMSTRKSVERRRIECGDMEMPCCADDAIKTLQSDTNSSEQSKENDSSNENAERDPSDHTYTSSEDQDEDEEEEEEEEAEAELVATHRRKCGYRSGQNTVTRIINGYEAQPNEFPWVVAMFMKSPSGTLRFVGGASLIHESVIMTAAHLVKQYTADQLVVRAGEHDILSPHKDEKWQERNVTDIIIHENEYVQALINDIALLMLDRPFKLSDSVNTICLPPQNVRTNGLCTSGGWGKHTADKSGQYQATMRKVELTVVEREKCTKLLRKTRLGKYYQLNKSLMCAGGGERDTGRGDGGSPLFCRIPNDKERFYQTGIVAGGVGFGGKIPGLYVNVAYFSNWIQQQLIHLDLEMDNIVHFEDGNNLN